MTGVTWTGYLASQYEGEEHSASGDDGRSFTGSSEFTVKIAPNNKGIRLRRRYDQQNPCQRARVSVDGRPVVERNWYQPWQNSYRRWGEDEFDIPASYTAGKSSVRIKIECIPLPEGRRQYAYNNVKGRWQDPWPKDVPISENIPRVNQWNEYRYWVFSHRR